MVFLSMRFDNFLKTSNYHQFKTKSKRSKPKFRKRNPLVGSLRIVISNDSFVLGERQRHSSKTNQRLLQFY